MGGRVTDSRVSTSLFLALLGVVMLVPACVHKEFNSVALSSSAPVEAGLPAATAAPDRERYQETGIASWYGADFQGKKTASGEFFDMNGFTAAHRTLPLGAIIQVTNLDNLKTVTIKVNDRGPFVANRILELSYGAAHELGVVAQGTVRVKIEAAKPQEPGFFTVQAAVFAEEENARLLKDRLSKKFEIISILPVESHLGTFYRVRVGSYASAEKAALIARKLKLEGLEPFVVRKD